MLHKVKLKYGVQMNSYNESISNGAAVPNQLHRNPSNISKTSNGENVAIQKLRSIADGKNISIEVSDVPSEVGYLHTYNLHNNLRCFLLPSLEVLINVFFHCNNFI